MAVSKSWVNVDRWLDKFFKMKGKFHRAYRHHRKGVEIVRKKWRDKAARAKRDFPGSLAPNHFQGLTGQA